MKRFLLSLTMALSLGFTSAAHANPEAAKNFVDRVSKQVLDIVKTDGLSKEQKAAKLEALFSDKVDINFVGRFVLGKHWRTATPAQQQAYLAAYKPFILKNYAGRLAKYSGQTYTLKNPRTDGDASMVTMEINDPNGPNVIVDYRLKGTDGNFRIVDIMVENVSLLTTQRSEFNGIVESKGVDGLIEALKKQVASKK